MSILRELPLTEGNVKVQGKISYVSQQPWVFSASLRQNIVFGNKFDGTHYNKIIKACALDKVNPYSTIMYMYISSIILLVIKTLVFNLCEVQFGIEGFGSICRADMHVHAHIYTKKGTSDCSILHITRTIRFTRTFMFCQFQDLRDPW